MSLAQRLKEYVSACFTGLWLQSYEHQDALREIAQLCRQQNWRMAVWDINRGLQVSGTRLVVYGAIVANFAIAVTKFIAAGITGSSAMLSEGIHSTVDSGKAEPPPAAPPDPLVTKALQLFTDRVTQLGRWECQVIPLPDDPAQMIRIGAGETACTQRTSKSGTPRDT